MLRRLASLGDNFSEDEVSNLNQDTLRSLVTLDLVSRDESTPAVLPLASGNIRLDENAE